MSLRLNGSTSGYVAIDAPAAAGSNTLTLPTGNGTSGQVLNTNGSGVLSWQTFNAGPTFRANAGPGGPGTALFFPRNTDTKIAYNTVDFDTDSCYDNTTNYRFTPTKAGYYFTTASVQLTFGAGGHPNTLGHYCTVYKNGSAYAWGYHNRYSTNTSEWFIGNQACTTLVYMNGSTDYLEAYTWSSDINPAIARGFGTFFESIWVHG